jgi:DNA mismatch repair protein MutS2
MQNSSLELLEFGALKALVRRYAASARGAELIDELEPLTDTPILARILSEVQEALEYLDTARKPQAASRGAAVRLRFDVPDISASVSKLAIEGAALDAPEILKVTEVLDRASDARAILSAVAERFPRLAAMGAEIGEFRPMLRELSGKILPDGTIADHASVALGRFRRDIERQRKMIQDSLERFLRVHRDDGILQEEFVTIRNDRFVVPLISGQQRRVEGVVHGSSGSGHTMFVEPLETIHLNNDLVRLVEEEAREVHRILREMTEHLRAHVQSIRRTYAVLGDLDALFAKAEFGAEFGCVVPRIGADGPRRFLLSAARHPLLEDVLRRQKRRVVPLSLTMDDNCRTLLISGPNTGGKTVSLKTAGLLAIMAQAGLPVPAAEAEFPIFDGVLADIGDQQSIEESLSTFSAHITRVRDMLEQVTPDSLVLLDELGRATDPEEGGALGVAVLERFRASGAFTLASTHLMALKIYGANTNSVLNGSMGFDEATLQPTFTLRLGAPGKSAGLDIASRLGMPAEVVAQAREGMSGADRDIARFLSELHERVDSVKEKEQQLDAERRAIASREEQSRKDAQKREAAKIAELERRCDLLMRKFDEQARETIGKIVEGIEQRKAAEQATRRVAKTKREFQEELRATVLNTQDEARQGQLDRPEVREGTRVRLRDVREPARVRRVLANGMLEVEAGFLKMQVGADEVLEVLPDAPEKSRLPKGVTFQSGPTWDVLQREINVIGQRAEEAVDNVDKFLDAAALASVQRVRIVHGHGMGVLKRAISEMLAGHPHVARFYPAPQSEGGAGATIAEMRES